MLTVTARHKSPRFECNVRPVRIGGDAQYGFYAIIAGYGCSRAYSTPERAIRGMLEDHACFDVVITGEYDPNEYVQI